MSVSTAAKELETTAVELQRVLVDRALNTSGIAPLDKRVLVLPDLPEDKIGSLFIPESVKEREKYAKIEATLIAVGETAWAEAAAEAQRYGAAFTRPAAGDRILIAKYGGIMHAGKDGKDYRIMNDEDVIARLEEA